MDSVIVLALLARQRRWAGLWTSHYVVNCIVPVSSISDDLVSGALFKFKLAAFLKSAQLFKEGAQYDSGHIFQVQFNLLFQVSALFQGGVGRAIREDSVLLNLDFIKDKVWSE